MADARREQVKRAALESLMERGFADMSVKDIARRAGVSTGILYHYFVNKDDILIQALAMAFRDADTALRRRVGVAQGDGARLDAYLLEAGTMGSVQQEAAQILLAALGQVGASEEVRTRLARLFADFRDYARELLQEASGDCAGDPPPSPDGAGVPHAADADVAAALIVAAGIGLACQWAVAPGSVDPTACGAALQDLFGSRPAPAGSGGYPDEAGSRS
jgi:AcrR family transcriptional regulator